MKKSILAAILAGSIGLCSTAHAQSDFDFTGLVSDLSGEPTRALVLGSTHINQVPAEILPTEHFSVLLDQLTPFQPDVVAIETLDGMSCERLQRYSDLYPGVAENYCYDTSHALDTLGMSMPEARKAAFEQLDALGDAPTIEERRRLAGLFYACGERWSAALQWSYLTPEQRVHGNGVSEATASKLDRLLASRNENNVIGVEIARRSGLNRLVAMDDHTADWVLARAPDAMEGAVQQMWSTSSEVMQELNARLMEFAGSPEKVVAGYRFLNSPEHQQITIDADFAKAARDPENSVLTRQYLAWWQTRGLRMAANVVEGAGNQPGARVLVIVGASHKSYFDAYLDQMHDIEIVDVDTILTN